MNMTNKIIYLLLFTIIYPAVDYTTEIQSIFDTRCGNCHLGNSSGGLNLSNYGNLMLSNTVTPGEHQTSILYDRITREESQSGDMPPTGSLSQSQIDIIAQWIDEGACNSGYTFIENENIPSSCFVIDQSNCFLTQDIEALQDIISANNLMSENPLIVLPLLAKIILLTPFSLAASNTL